MPAWDEGIRGDNIARRMEEEWAKIRFCPKCKIGLAKRLAPNGLCPIDRVELVDKSELDVPTC